MNITTIFQNKFFKWGIFGLAAIGVIITMLIIIVPAELEAGSYTTYRADYGDVLQTIDAQGIVEPENEVLLNSPASSSVEKIYLEPGSHVKAGQIILRLDNKPIQNAIENLEDQIKIKKNSLTKLNLRVQSTKLDLDFTEENKKLNIASIKSELVDQEKLLEVGGISQAKFEKTKQALVSAEKELQMTVTKNRISLKQLQAEKEGLELQIEIQEKNLANKQALLNQMNFRAPSNGIILKITKKEGEKINEGELLVQISNLSSFKIRGEIDEKYADFLKTGKQVFAQLDKEKLCGQVGMIKPVIENNKLYFDVYIDSSNHPKLIPNQKVDLKLVKNRKNNVLRVSKGNDFSNAQKQTFYVVKNSKAIATQVKTGLQGDDYISIKEGINEGDLVITSDVSTFRRAKIIELK